MKAVLMSFSIYWLYLILEDKKKEEVRKHIPQSKDWNKIVKMYANKSKRELMRIPAIYREKYRKLMGKVVGEFTCDSYRKGKADNLVQAYCHNSDETCLTDRELLLYANTGKPVYFLHISDLKIYEQPKELGEFKVECKEFGKDKPFCDDCNYERYYASEHYSECLCDGIKPITRPPQSWCYVEDIA